MEKKEGDLKKSIYGLAQRRDRLRAENSRLMALNSLSILEDTSQMSDDRKLGNSTRPQARIKSDKAEPQELPTPKTLSACEIGIFDFSVTFNKTALFSRKLFLFQHTQLRPPRHKINFDSQFKQYNASMQPFVNNTR